MTKAELQTELAEATQTDKRTAGVFLDTLSALAYKEINVPFGQTTAERFIDSCRSSMNL